MNLYIDERGNKSFRCSDYRCNNVISYEDGIELSRINNRIDISEIDEGSYY